MNSFEKLLSIGMDNYGIVTSEDAKSVGLSDRVVFSHVKNGKLLRRGQGIFKLAIFSSSDEMDRYAEAVAFGGKGAMIYGESVLAMLNLAFANPPLIEVATNRRVRKKLPTWVKIVRIGAGMAMAEYYRGIPCQPLRDAIRLCKGRILPERILAAIESAKDEGWLSSDDGEDLKKEIRKEVAQ